MVTQLGKCFWLLLLIFISQITAIRLALVYTTVSALALLDGVAEPISAALVPHYVPESDLIRANSLLDGAYQLLGIGSWAVGSSLLAFFTPTQLLIASMLFGLLAAGLICRLPNTK